jgi:hypothetical protein
MKDISFILSGRDDGYTGNFIDRFEIALKKNLEILKTSKLNYEIIIIDYNPSGENTLINNHKLKMLLTDDDILNIIVDRSVIIDDNLDENGFYEYFAKNIGAIKSSGKLLFMTNCDIIISDDIAEYLNILSKDFSNNSFYRVRYRQDINNIDDIVNANSALDLHEMSVDDNCICGAYSGDATVFPRNVFIDIATGYNETDPAHRTSNGQASMDGEILWNLVKQNVSKELIDLTYYHVTHPRQIKDNSYSMEVYKNRDNWGCVNYQTEFINSNTIKIYK